MMRSFVFSTMLMAGGLLASGDVGAADVFMGTIAAKDGALVLTRCDVAQTRYALRDADGAAAVSDLRAQTPAKAGFWYGEVVGDVVEADGAYTLVVQRIEGLRDGHSCHLADALGANRADGVTDPAPVFNPDSVRNDRSE